MAETSNPSSLPPVYSQFNTIENRNFLSPIGFKFTIQRMRGVDFMCQSVTLPSIGMGSPIQGTRFNKIPQPGDELEYSDLRLRFLVDENMKNWEQVYDWMREITTPYSNTEFGFDRGKIASSQFPPRRVREDGGLIDNQWRSDCMLKVLSSNYRTVREFVFKDAFPIELTPLPFDSSVGDIQYFTAEVVLKYNYFDVYTGDAAEATDSTMKANYRVSEKGILFDEL